MSLYTAARKSNVLAMCWDNINLTDATWGIPYTETKNGESHLLPLSEEAMEILKLRYEQRDLQCPWAFPSDCNSKSGHIEEPKKAWKRLVKRAKLKDFRLHDLRRTMGSWMAIAGASQYVISKALNHKSPKSTLIYARLSIDPVREFMNKANKIFNKNTTDTNNIRKKAIQNLMLPEDTVTSQTKIADNIETQRRENAARQRKIEELEQQIRELKIGTTQG